MDACGGVALGRQRGEVCEIHSVSISMIDRLFQPKLITNPDALLLLLLNPLATLTRPIQPLRIQNKHPPGNLLDLMKHRHRNGPHLTDRLHGADFHLDALFHAGAAVGVGDYRVCCEVDDGSKRYGAGEEGGVVDEGDGEGDEV